MSVFPLTQELAANARSFGGDLRRWPEEARARALAAVVHACDIGNPAKPLALSLQWSERIIAENFAQVRACSGCAGFTACPMVMVRKETGA